MSLGPHSTLESVAISVGDALRRHGVHAVLTGGACASIHSAGGYTSSDVDFILGDATAPGRVAAALESLGFQRRIDRFVHSTCPYFVEFPRGPLAIGRDTTLRPVRIRRAAKVTLALSATDSCRDRLAAYYHWRDRQALQAAVAIALQNRLAYARIRRWSIEEGALEEYGRFLDEVRRRRSPTRSSSRGRR